MKLKTTFFISNFVVRDFSGRKVFTGMDKKIKLFKSMEVM